MLEVPMYGCKAAEVEVVGSGAPGKTWTSDKPPASGLGDAILAELGIDWDTIPKTHRPKTDGPLGRRLSSPYVIIHLAVSQSGGTDVTV
jgi:hypothetical protein